MQQIMSIFQKYKQSTQQYIQSSFYNAFLILNMILVSPIALTFEFFTFLFLAVISFLALKYVDKNNRLPIFWLNVYQISTSLIQVLKHCVDTATWIINRVNMKFMFHLILTYLSLYFIEKSISASYSWCLFTNMVLLDYYATEKARSRIKLYFNFSKNMIIQMKIITGTQSISIAHISTIKKLEKPIWKFDYQISNQFFFHKKNKNKQMFLY